MAVGSRDICMGDHDGGVTMRVIVGMMMAVIVFVVLVMRAVVAVVFVRYELGQSLVRPTASSPSLGMYYREKCPHSLLRKLKAS